MVITTSPLVKTDTAKKEVEVRSFEAGKMVVYEMTDILRSEVLPNIQIPIASLFAD